jgi:hypothetical protein
MQELTEIARAIPSAMSEQRLAASMVLCLGRIESSSEVEIEKVSEAGVHKIVRDDRSVVVWHAQPHSATSVQPPGIRVPQLVLQEKEPVHPKGLVVADTYLQQL